MDMDIDQEDNERLLSIVEAEVEHVEDHDNSHKDNERLLSIVEAKKEHVENHDNYQYVNKVWIATEITVCNDLMIFLGMDKQPNDI